MRADSFISFLSKMKMFPLWVKQVLYFNMKTDLEKLLTQNSMNIAEKDFLQIYRPEITFIGKKELNERNNYHEEVMYTFLKALLDHKSIIEITLDCFFTLEEISKLCIEAEEKEYVKTPQSNIIKAMTHFFAGRIKTGEFLMRIGRLTVDQLDMAIRHQERLEKEGKKIPMAEVLTSLQFIKKDEIISILMMKEEAKKRFIFNIDLNSGEISNSDVITLRKQVEKLTYENEYLKTKIKAILKME